MPFLRDFDFVIGALESTPGVAETLDQDDRNICFVSGSIEYAPTVEIDDEGSKCANGEHGENESITGNQYATLNFTYKYRWSNAVATAPKIGKFFQGCGQKETVIGATGVKYEPLLEMNETTMTISYYQREISGTNYKVHKMAGCIGNSVITCDATGKPLLVNFTFQGKIIPDTDSASVPDAAAAFDTQLPEKFLEVPVTTYGNSLKVSTFTLDPGNDIQPYYYATDSTGIDYYIITKRAPRLSMNILDERVATFDFYGTLKDMTTGAINIPFQTNHIAIKAPNVQLISYTKGEREGLNSIEANFKCLRNGTTDATIDAEATFQLLQGATS